MGVMLSVNPLTSPDEVRIVAGLLAAAQMGHWESASKIAVAIFMMDEKKQQQKRGAFGR